MNMVLASLMILVLRMKLLHINYFKYETHYSVLTPLHMDSNPNLSLFHSQVSGGQFLFIRNR